MADLEPPTKNQGSKVVDKLAEIEAGLREKDVVVLPWIKTPKADMFFGIIIMGNAGFIGIDLEMAPDGFSWVFWSCESVFLFVFLIELTMRLCAERPKMRRFFFAAGCKPELWGIFDFSVTILGCVDCWVVTPLITLSSGDGESPMSSFTVLRVFRLVRLARLIRVLRMFSELVVLVQTLGNSIRAVGWMTLLLGIIMYTGSIICIILLDAKKSDNEDIIFHFGTLGDAIFSHFCVVTLEAWPDVARAAMQQSPLWALYFVGMITLTNFALVNLMVGVIVERIIHFSQEQETELSAFVAESEQFRATLRALFDEADIDQNGEVTKEEVRALMEDTRTHDIFTAFGINLDIPPDTLFTIMDLMVDGPTSVEEFSSSCIRLCGSKQSGIHPIFVQSDICQARSQLLDKLTDIEQEIQKEGPSTRTYGGRSGGPIVITPSTGSTQQASPEECMTELIDRMDRFDKVQLQFCAEIEALKEQARNRSPKDGPMLGGGPGSKVINKGGTEMPSCIDSLFCKRKPQIAKAGTSNSSSRNNSRDGKQTRKDLEEEFRNSRK